MRSHRNQLLPAYRLPNDILVIIFEFSKDASSNCLRPLSRRAPLNVSRVSKLWRDVTMSAPSLWNTVDAINASVAGVFLERSRNVNLSINLTSYENRHFSDDEDTEEPHLRFPISRDQATTTYERHLVRFTDFIEPLLPHINRWESISLEGVSGSQIEEHFTSPAPNIQTLRISEIRGSASAVLPIALFGAKTPRLRTLKLFNISLPLSSPIYRNLRSLSLAYIDNWDETLHRFLNVLLGCPLLTTLHLTSISFLGSPTTSDVLSIPLRHLKTISLYYLAGSVFHYILSSITAPPTLLLDVAAKGNDVTLTGIFPPASAIATFHPGLSLIRWFHFEFRSSSDLFDVHGGSLEPHQMLLDIQFGKPQAFNIAQSFISLLGRDFPPLDLKSLSLEDIVDTLLSFDDFVMLMSDRSDITSLTLSGGSLSFLNGLIIDRNTHLLPRLQELRLQDLTLDPATLLQVVNSRTPPRPRSRRVNQGNTYLRSLVISCCTGVDYPALLALRRPSLRVQMLGPESRIGEVRYSLL